MTKRDPMFSNIASKFKRADFNEAFHEMEITLARYPSLNKTRELGTQNSILHVMALDKDIEPEVFTRLAKTFEYDFVVQDTNSGGHTPVDILIREQKVAHLISLTKEGMLNLKDYASHGYNALHLAAGRDNPRFIQFLVKQGVNPEATNNQNLKPIDIARRFAAFSNVDALESLDPNADKNNPNEFYDLGLK